MRVDEETRAFFETLMLAAPPPQQARLRLLIANQLSTLRNAKHDSAGRPVKTGRCVWHIEVLQWCTDVYRASPGAYEHMWDGGFLALPHPDTLRKRAATVSVGTGECRALFEALEKRLHSRTLPLCPQRTSEGREAQAHRLGLPPAESGGVGAEREGGAKCDHSNFSNLVVSQSQIRLPDAARTHGPSQAKHTEQLA